jgi:hypothetical protein
MGSKASVASPLGVLTTKVEVCLYELNRIRENEVGTGLNAWMRRGAFTAAYSQQRLLQLSSGVFVEKCA